MGAGAGARVLRQDPVECLFQFVCSSNNHISRIQGMVDRLCTAYGTRLQPASGGAAPAPEPATHFAFPTLEQLSRATEEELRAAGFGYRWARCPTHHAPWHPQCMVCMLVLFRDWLITVCQLLGREQLSEARLLCCACCITPASHSDGEHVDLSALQLCLMLSCITSAIQPFQCRLCPPT